MKNKKIKKYLIWLIMTVVVCCIFEANAGKKLFNSNFIMNNKGIFPYSWLVNKGVGKYEAYRIISNQSWGNLWLDNSNIVYFKVATSAKRPVHFFNVLKLPVTNGEKIVFHMALRNFKGKIAMALYLYDKKGQVGAVTAKQLKVNWRERIYYREAVIVPIMKTRKVQNARVVIIIYPKSEVSIEYAELSRLREKTE